MRILFSLILILAVAACGDDGHSHDEDGGHNDGSSQGHGDEHGEAHHIGHADLEGGYYVSVDRIGELEASKEGVFEVEAKKGDEALTGATVICWLEDAQGNAVTRTPKGLYMSDEKRYDVHLTLPPKMEEGMILKVRLQHEGTDQTTAIPLK